NSALTSRIDAILDETRNRARSSIGTRAMVALAAIALIAPLSAFQSQGPYKVGNGVSAPKIVFKVQPDYTDDAKSAKIEGSVLVQAVIGADGGIRDMEITKHLEPSLDANTLVALAQWKFQPGMKDGAPVDVSVTIEVNFKLK